jgi:uncharacterized surface protein with fasciclin (FAS1) repeats
MKKILAALALIGAASAVPAFAHCGSCGVGETHSHAAEASTGDIVAVASSAESLKTLVAAVKADVMASNGVIHVIDTVIIPAS